MKRQPRRCSCLGSVFGAAAWRAEERMEEVHQTFSLGHGLSTASSMLGQQRFLRSLETVRKCIARTGERRGLDGSVWGLPWAGSRKGDRIPPSGASSQKSCVPQDAALFDAPGGRGLLDQLDPDRVAVADRPGPDGAL